jgi:hypothetical protein
MVTHDSDTGLTRAPLDAHVNRNHANADPASASTAELVSRAAQQVTTLVRDELALAKAEMAAKGRRAGLGGGLLGGAGLLALYGLALLLTLAVVLLALVWPTWLAVLVVMLVVFGAAAVAALVGRRQLQKAAPAVPSESAARLAVDVATVKSAVREGRQR